MSDPGRLIECSFCPEQVASSAMGDHLMMCGNKTDQCPNCRKYIRRAIFAYHYENNCANLDTDETDSRTTADPSVIVPSLSPESNAGNRKNVFVTKVNLETQVNSDLSRCQFCHHLCETTEQNIHEKTCLQNPGNIAKRSTSHSNPTPYHQNQLQHTEPVNDTTNIPCEYCLEPVEWHNYEAHTNACFTRHQQQTQRTTVGYTTSIIQCQYCNEQRPEAGMEAHLVHCIRSPNYLDTEVRYRSAYNLPRTLHLKRSDHLN